MTKKRRNLSPLQRKVISGMEMYRGYTQHQLGITFKTVSCLSKKGIFESDGYFIYLSSKGGIIKRIIENDQLQEVAQY